MERKNYLEIINADDLQNQYKILADLIGLDNLIKLVNRFGGTQIYLPKPEELTKELKYKKIREEYSGGNIRELAIKYDLSERTIYRIIREVMESAKTKPLAGQLNFFDCQKHCQ